MLGPLCLPPAIRSLWTLGKKTMKPLFFGLMLLSIATLSVASPLRQDKAMALPRLTQVDSFPEQYRDAVRAVSAVLTEDGGKPGEYFVEIHSNASGVLEFYLKHESHPLNISGGLGDICGRCRVTNYNPNTGAVSRIHGIR